MENYYFHTQQLTVGYNGKPLIKDIEIALPKGQILTLIGPNGAGKSTVLKSIACQLEKVGGMIYVGKQELTKMKGNERARKMSVVFTEKVKTELMTCEEVVATGRYPYTGKFGTLSKEDWAVVEEALELIQITELREKDFNQISDGQKQRVMLARAICQEPELLILDEPTSFLDVKYKLEFLSVLQKLKNQKQLTVIMSLHELELAERVSDQILCLKGEHVAKYGAPETIFQKGYLQELFDIQRGTFDETNGTMELERPEGEPQVFVIAGGGSGREVYRRLQREGKPFATGIIYENDLDAPVAEALAKKVVLAKAFERMTEAQIEEAKELIDKCQEVICCRDYFGTLEEGNRILWDYAKQMQKARKIQCEK